MHLHFTKNSVKGNVGEYQFLYNRVLNIHQIIYYTQKWI